jgi:serine/threonine protein kinase
MALQNGTRLGSHEIIGLLGAGGMGEVYRAHDTKLNRQGAIKVLPEAYASDPERIARFHREAQAVAALNHPSIAAIYELAESGNTKFLGWSWSKATRSRKDSQGSGLRAQGCRSKKRSRSPGRSSMPWRPRTRRASAIAT